MLAPKLVQGLSIFFALCEIGTFGAAVRQAAVQFTAELGGWHPAVA
jgi:hypothetical protein